MGVRKSVGISMQCIPLNIIADNVTAAFRIFWLRTSKKSKRDSRTGFFFKEEGGPYHLALMDLLPLVSKMAPKS